jgi:hypothetical protein
MNALDHLIPTPALLEIDHVDIAAPAVTTWALIRNGDLARTPLIRALFMLRAIPERLAGRTPEPNSLRLDDLRSTAERPGFQVLSSDAPHEVAVGAIGKVWQPEILFAHVPDADGYAAFAEPGFVKVAWALRVESLGAHSRLSIELRVDATDRESWTKFQHYFLLIGPASRFIRRSGLGSIAKDLGTLSASEQERPLAGDELLPDADAQLDDGITIEATPEKIWPWLIQMGSNRGGFYSIDLFDNAAIPSARELHPEWQRLEVGQLIDNTPDGHGAFEVLRVDAPRVLILGGLFDPDTEERVAFAAMRPKRFWHVTWTFALEPITESSTRVHVRARAAFSSSEALHVAWIRPVHHLMETAQLRHLRARVEGTLRRDDSHDVLDGLDGMTRMCLAFAAPFTRLERSHWGLPAEAAARTLPGDDRVAAPRWSWTHAVEIDASAAEVWPWVAQIGATRGGFYSYQWLENLVGCDVRNAETLHPEWVAKIGDDFFLHPKTPALKVVELQPGRSLVVYGAPDDAAHAAGKPWVAASWLFFIEPLGDRRCRLVSRYRVAYSDDLTMQLSFGPSLLEPVGFVMDRRMLLGIKARSESSSHPPISQSQVEVSP